MAKEKKKATLRFDYTKPIPSDTQLRSRLTPEQYRLTRENGTEGAFHNQYWDNFRAGIYIDIISGEPLFGSLDKFDGKTGRPSFTKPLAKAHIVEKPDSSQGMERTEVRARQSDYISGMSSMTDPRPLVCATRSIPARCGLFRWRNFETRATAIIFHCLRILRATARHRKTIAESLASTWSNDMIAGVAVTAEGACALPLNLVSRSNGPCAGDILHNYARVS